MSNYIFKVGDKVENLKKQNEVLIETLTEIKNEILLSENKKDSEQYITVGLIENTVNEALAQVEKMRGLK